MRRSSVRAGLNLISTAVAFVIVAAFFHEQAATLFFLHPGAEEQLVMLGLFWGGIAGFAGIVVLITGMVRPTGGPYTASLKKPLFTLIFLVVLFVLLLVSSFELPDHQKLRPGETITI